MGDRSPLPIMLIAYHLLPKAGAMITWMPIGYMAVMGCQVAVISYRASYL